MAKFGDMVNFPPAVASQQPLLVRHVMPRSVLQGAKPMKLVPLVAFLVLAGCGQDSAADNNAAALERAAEQSTPEAADILLNAAENGSSVQDAMQAAGNAQAAQAPPQQGAKPHAPGDPVPPPKIPAGGNATGNSH
jgi:ribosomal protein L12E/L44/L45/RPP1/RPP2